MKSINPQATARLKISALVVTLNEGHLLEKCLSSIDFCEEIYVVDLGSIDNSIPIAKKYTDSIFSHERLPSSEYLRPIYVPQLKNDWVLIIDPDEHITFNLKSKLISIFPQLSRDNEISCIIVPWIFFFGKKRLLGTPWGGSNSKVIIANRNNFEFVPLIHNSQRIANNKKVIHTGNVKNDEYLHHLWMTDWKQFIEKHLRYLKAEGEARFTLNSNPRMLNSLLLAPKEFIWALVVKKAYLDGVLGILLSFFWTWYQTSARLQHWKYSRKKIKK